MHYHSQINTSQEEKKGSSDLSTLVEESVFELSKFKENVSPVADISKFEKFKGKATEKMVGVLEEVKRDIGFGLGKIRKKAFRYPWAALTAALAVGFLMGSLIKPTRKVLKLFK
jgi:hypothetical protein